MEETSEPHKHNALNVPLLFKSLTLKNRPSAKDHQTSELGTQGEKRPTVKYVIMEKILKAFRERQ